MNFTQLVEYQTSGALKVSYDATTGIIKLGGTPVTREICSNIVTGLGWERYDAKPWEIIDKTDKFIKSMSKYLCEQAMVGLDVTFRNFRRSNTESYYDRIKLISPYMNFTVLYHMPGLGGTYAIFTPKDNFQRPDYACRSVKQLCEYINEYFE